MELKKEDQTIEEDIIKEEEPETIEEIDTQLDALIDQGGLSLRAACDALGINYDTHRKRRRRKEAPSQEPRVLNISYPEETSKHVVIMIGDAREIMSLLKATGGAQ
jgi:hypothetical protein